MRATQRECVTCGEMKLLRFFPLAEPENPLNEQRITKCFKCAPEAHKYAKKFDDVDCPFAQMGRARRAKYEAEREAARTPIEIQNRNASRRRARRIKQATPRWANKGAMLNIYKKAKRKSIKSGIVHHVDHIIPIYSEYVCGLHVENNLQIIPAHENLKKSHKFIPTLVDTSPSDVAHI